MSRPAIGWAVVPAVMAATLSATPAFSAQTLSCRHVAHVMLPCPEPQLNSCLDTGFGPVEDILEEHRREVAFEGDTTQHWQGVGPRLARYRFHVEVRGGAITGLAVEDAETGHVADASPHLAQIPGLAAHVNEHREGGIALTAECNVR